ncbi:hypothetical protein CONPUDRAFT_160509 [Coniophora puteana RWD-64-598 SS2]|uniref:Uncharacterized protein n=1 Tax=Coniophora puteana (strain RWD-64-598) TaxID=741705 RepID=R7SE42_CONPW|nr:uncharacterized protein CONPUDRAFT_160509 [Coniophora puteana RWD-64-598 SS2]EIW74017.1 hypothetical protein CONPUDRAFT_160509 [Coniophora puteana RWD-64-598 SS2]
MAQYYALEALRNLVRICDDSERRQLGEDLLEEDIVGLCLQLLHRYPCILHEAVTNLLRALAGDAFLGNKLSSSVVADAIEGVCRYALAGPDYVISQMLDPLTTWQSSVFPDSGGVIPMDKAARFAPLYYSMIQDNAVGIAYALMGVFPSHTPKFCLEILQKTPHIIDLLLDCAVLDRYPRNPEAQTCMLACETLALLLQWPCNVVPGVPSPLDKAFKVQEWKAMLQMMSIFTSRGDWFEKLIEVWMHVQEEDMMQVQRDVAKLGTADPGELPSPPSLQGVVTIYGDRGTIRSIVLRLIATLTHAAESCGITNAQIESFLHVAYLSGSKGKTPEQCTSYQERLEATEYGAELFLYTTGSDATESATGQCRVGGSVAIEGPVTIASQHVLGPTALVRLLVVLAQRKALDGIQTLKKAPAGLSTSTSLNQVQHITHPDIIRRIINISQSRILERTERGRQRIKEKKDDADINLACSMFVSSAELAAAVVALDTYTEGVYAAEALGARKQLVIALGNASQMALNLGYYQRALHYGCGAVSAAEDIPVEEGLNPSITEKNQRRINQANEGLQCR